MSEQPARPKIVPGNFATLRANETGIFHDAGTFILSLAEQRQAVEEGKLVPVIAEVGRFMLTPIAIYWLRKNIDTAVLAYEKLLGHPLPNPEKIIADAAIDSLQQTLKPPETT